MTIVDGMMIRMSRETICNLSKPVLKNSSRTPVLFLNLKITSKVFDSIKSVSRSELQNHAMQTEHLHLNVVFGVFDSLGGRVLLQNRLMLKNAIWSLNRGFNMS